MSDLEEKKKKSINDISDIYQLLKLNEQVPFLEKMQMGWHLMDAAKRILNPLAKIDYKIDNLDGYGQGVFNIAIPKKYCGKTLSIETETHSDDKNIILTLKAVETGVKDDTQ